MPKSRTKDIDEDGPVLEQELVVDPAAPPYTPAPEIEAVPDESEFKALSAAEPRRRAAVTILRAIVRGRRVYFPGGKRSSRAELDEKIDLLLSYAGTL